MMERFLERISLLSIVIVYLEGWYVGSGYGWIGCPFYDGFGCNHERSQ